MPNKKASDVKNPTGRKSEGFSFRKTKIHLQLQKTKAKIHPQWWNIKTNHLPIPACFQMRLRAAIELDQIVDDLRHQRKKSKQWVAQSKHKQRLSESS